MQIRVDGRSDSGVYRNEISVLKGKGLNDFTRVIRRVRSTNGDSDSDRDNSAKRILLLIDGYRVGYLDSVNEFLAYIKYFTGDLVRIEIYTGQSAAWLNDDSDDDKVSSVVNFVTDNELYITEEVPQS